MVEYKISEKGLALSCKQESVLTRPFSNNALHFQVWSRNSKRIKVETTLICFSLTHADLDSRKVNSEAEHDFLTRLQRKK